MTATLDCQWNLRKVMAGRAMFTPPGPPPLLAERGITLSPARGWRL